MVLLLKVSEITAEPFPWRARRIAVKEFGKPIKPASTKVPSTGWGNQCCPKAVGPLYKTSAAHYDRPDRGYYPEHRFPRFCN